MLKQATKDALKTTYGFDVDKLIEAVKAEAEVDYELPKDQTVLKNADLQTRDTNNKAEGKKEGEIEGEKKGRELAAKAFKKKFSLDENLPNDPDKIVEAVNTHLSKGDQALKDQVAALLKDKETLIAEKAAAEKKSKESEFDSRLISYFPPGRSADLKDAERLALLKMDLSFEEADGKTIVKRNGQVVAHKDTHAPLSPAEVIPEYFTERKWIATPGGGGRGGNDNPPGGGGAGIKTYSKFEEKWKAENPNGNVVSPEFQDALNKHAKDMPDFDYFN